MSRYTTLLILLFSISSHHALCEFPQLKILTEQNQPFNFVDPNDSNKKIQGIAVDLLVEILEKSGSSQGLVDIELIPWARGYYEVQHVKNTVLFSTTRTAERESLFKWVCPIKERKTQLIAKKASNIAISDVSEVSKFKIGTVREDVGEQLLIKSGVPEKTLARTTKYENNLRKLNFGRID